MRRQRQTKIVATLGPASSSESMIEQLFLTGVDVFRINMSHTKHDTMREYVAMIRRVEAKVGRPISILADLQGPKLRLGTFKEGKVLLVNGQNLILDRNPEPGDATRVYVPHPEVMDALEPGHAILIDDGKVKIIVRSVTPTHAVAEVVVAGHISDRKGISLPDTTIPVSAMTPKDYSDAEAVVATGVDWVALSFVQRPEDIADLKKITRDKAAVLAKVEKPQAVKRMAEIIEVSDAIMVARGDLGVEMPVEEVPGIQKQLTYLCRRAGKPVIVATQMLESMISSPVPTRAEVSDVATAVFDGADAVMLSAETAAGQFPLESVRTMSRVAETVERDPTYRATINAQRGEVPTSGPDSIASAARDMSENMEVGAIVCWTSSGASARRVARERPRSLVMALSPSQDVARRLALVWGVHPIVTEDARDVDDMATRACEFAQRDDFAKAGQKIVVVAGIPFGTPGATNMMRIATIQRS
jgi:pyruvate kinase